MIGSDETLAGSRKTINYFRSSQYQDLKSKWVKLNDRYSKTPQVVKVYPEKDFEADLLQIDEERIEVQKKLCDLKGEVNRLTQTFAKIPVETDRLKFAREHFEAGNYVAARLVFNAEQMTYELDLLLSQKNQLAHQQAQYESDLIDKANEFLILAHLTAVDFTLADRNDKAIGYFQHSLKAAYTTENTSDFACFLQQHGQVTTAIPLYEKALEIYRWLAEDNPETYLPDVAVTLNNLANLQKSRNKFATAQAGHQEALAIYRRLDRTNPKVWLQHVASTLNHLALSQKSRNKFADAQASYKEILAIYRQLAGADPEVWMQYVAGTLNNLALVQQAMSDFSSAELGYREALSIFRGMTESNHLRQLPAMAVSLNNLANLQKARNQFSAARVGYHQALILPTPGGNLSW
jgi:hypothetical protein